MPRITASIETARRLRAQLVPPLRAGVLAFGDARIDAHLPGGGLPLGLLHELTATGLAAETGATAAAFAAWLLARLPAGAGGAPRRVLWAATCCDLHAPGLLAYGLDPARLVLVRTRDDAETLQVMETALREGGLAAVVGEVGRLGRLAGRRLHLACRRRDVTGFVLRRHPHGAGRAAEREGTAVATRWRITAAPSRSDLPDALGPREPGAPSWRLELLHARGGREGGWLVEIGSDEVSDAPPALRVVAELSAAPAAPARRAAAG